MGEITEEKGIALRGDKEIALYELETRFAIAVLQRDLLAGYIREHLKPIKHYYSVAGSDKPSLKKEGGKIIKGGDCKRGQIKRNTGTAGGSESHS